MNKNLLILGFVFFFTFFGFSGVQFFLTSYYQSIGHQNAGFHSLLLIYGGFLFGSLFLVGAIKKIGSKKSMVLAPLFYGLFIFSLLGNSLFLLYASSLLVGISASFLWIGQQSYIILALKGKNIGKAIGIVNVFLFLGASLGSLLLGYLIPLIGYEKSFLIFGFFPLVAMPISFYLKEYSENIHDTKINIGIMFKYFKNSDLLKLGFFGLSLNFTAGLFFSIVPIHIKDILGVTYVGVITAFYFLMVMKTSYLMGKYIDKYDNRKIIFMMFILGILAMIMLFFYKVHYILICIGVLLLSLMFSAYTPLIGSIVTLISGKNNIKYFSSFFMIFGNIGLVFGILFASYIHTNIVYMVGGILLVLSLMIYYTISKKSFSSIKKDVDILK